MVKTEQLKIKLDREWLRQGDSVVVNLVPSLASEAERGTNAGSAAWCHLFLGSPIFPVSTDLSDKAWLFLELESMAGDGKLWCCFPIQNPRHRDVAAMRQTLHSVSTGGAPPPLSLQRQGSHRQLATALGVI